MNIDELIKERKKVLKQLNYSIPTKVHYNKMKECLEILKSGESLNLMTLSPTDAKDKKRISICLLCYGFFVHSNIEPEELPTQTRNFNKIITIIDSYIIEYCVNNGYNEEYDTDGEYAKDKTIKKIDKYLNGLIKEQLNETR